VSHISVSMSEKNYVYVVLCMYEMYNVILNVGIERKKLESISAEK
jgi:hypothetical protein